MLHLDAAATYGTHWAALHLDEFVAWATALQSRGSGVAVNGHAPDDELRAEAAARYSCQWCTVRIAVSSIFAHAMRTAAHTDRR